MNIRQWEMHQSNVENINARMDKILGLVSRLILAVNRLPNITHEIVELTNTIKQDTIELNGVFNAK